MTNNIEEGHKVRRSNGMVGSVHSINYSPTVVVELEGGIRELWAVDDVEPVLPPPAEPEENLAIRWSGARPWIRMVGERGPRWIGWQPTTSSWDSLPWDELPHPLADVPPGTLRVLTGDEVDADFVALVGEAVQKAVHRVPEGSTDFTLMDAVTEAVVAAVAERVVPPGHSFPVLSDPASDNAEHGRTD